MTAASRPATVRGSNRDRSTRCRRATGISLRLWRSAANLQFVVSYLDDRRHLPIVSIKQAA
jgi:hypothetical protein